MAKSPGGYFGNAVLIVGGWFWGASYALRNRQLLFLALVELGRS